MRYGWRVRYVRQSEVYLDERTPAALRGMAEMLLMKLGELMTRPAHVRHRLRETPTARPSAA